MRLLLRSNCLRLVLQVELTPKGRTEGQRRQGVYGKRDRECKLSSIHSLMPFI